MNMLSDDSDYDNCTESSDSEDQDSESTYGGNAQNILSSLDESIGKIDDFLSYERGFMHGDVVCSVVDKSGQLGRVIDVEMIVDLETRFGEPMKDVNSKLLQKVLSIASGDYVVHGPWLGRVERVHVAVTILFNDRAKCEIMTGDSEVLTVISPKNFEDAPPFPYYFGQRVRIKLPYNSQSVRWLSGSVNTAARNEGTICDVEAGLVSVNWIASVTMSCSSVAPPPYLQNPKNLTLLPCFPYANWQLGDWCILPTKRHSRDCKQMHVITKTKTKVNVLWQNGSISVSLDSHTLFPVNSVGDHDFWPGQFVLEKATSEELDSSSGPRLGVVKSVDARDRTVNVKWKVLEGEVGEEIVSAYGLIEHPDFSYCIGDIICRASPHCENLENSPQAIQINEGNAEDSSSYLSYIGNVIGFKDECIEVKWATSVISKVQPSEIFGLDRLGDPVPIPAVIEESVPQIVGKEMSEQERKICLSKEKVVNDFTEAYEKDEWAISSLFFPCTSIGSLKSIATSVFGSGFSASLLGFWKGVPEFETLKSEESNLDRDDDTEPQSMKQQVVEETELELKSTPLGGNEEPRMFRQFDIVDEYSDHHFANNVGQGLSSQGKRYWLKKVQQEWGILKKDLPDSIYVRVYEENIELLRACIVGTPGTPYHDGLFFFDVLFPPNYPHEPPVVHYISGGLRLNPNLYESGKVCLSLLNTWAGTGTEMWDPESSTILQVLLSLQALVLNDKPYFNEAGYDKQMGRAEGEKNSITYNENAFLLSCKSMLYLLRRPPKHFEELVEEHFTCRSNHILMAFKAYMDGAPVGYPFKATTGSNSGDNCSSTGFKIMLTKLFPKLLSAFQEKGIDCAQFL